MQRSVPEEKTCQEWQAVAHIIPLFWRRECLSGMRDTEEGWNAEKEERLKVYALHHPHLSLQFTLAPPSISLCSQKQQRRLGHQGTQSGTMLQHNEAAHLNFQQIALTSNLAESFLLGIHQLLLLRWLATNAELWAGHHCISTRAKLSAAMLNLDSPHDPPPRLRQYPL